MIPSQQQQAEDALAKSIESRVMKETGTGKQYLKEETLVRIERAQSRRVGTVAARAWLAQQIEKGRFTVPSGSNRRDPPKTVRALGTTEARQAAISAQGATEEEKTKEMVRRWLRKNAEPDDAGRYTLTIPMESELVRAIACHGRTTRDVRAMEVVLAAENEVRVNWRLQVGKGGARDGLAEAKDWMVQKKWMTEGEATGKIERARQWVSSEVPRKVIIDVMSGWEGTKDGLQRVTTTYTVDESRKQLGEGKGLTTPDVITEACAVGSKQDMIERLRARTKVKAQENVGMHMSPQCTEWSKKQGMEKTQGRGTGPCAGGEVSKGAMEEMEAIVKSVSERQAKEPGWAFTIEQPEGSKLVQHLQQIPNSRAVKLHMCCYDDQYQWPKPTVFVTNIPAAIWTPRPHNRHNPETRCVHCREGTRHKQTMMRKDSEDKRPIARLPGYSQAASHNRIAPNAAEEIGHAMVAMWEAEREKTNGKTRKRKRSQTRKK